MHFSQCKFYVHIKEDEGHKRAGCKVCRRSSAGCAGIVPPKRGEVGEGAFAEVEEGLKEGRETVFLFWRDGEGSEERVHDHPGEGHAL